tara:strand:+ start:1309 stop:1872 length:564 start_codon:yes stop_codon:yes gene_type:complete
MAKTEIFSDSFLHTKLLNPQLDNRIVELLEKYINHKQKNTDITIGSYQTPHVDCPFVLNTLLEQAGVLLRDNYKFKNKTNMKIYAWINKNNKYDFNKPHIHKANFSGIYYVQVPKENGNLVFMKNNLAEEFNDNDRYLENFAFVRYNIQPQANQFILFPSNIMHLVEPHYEDKPRISISFNIDFSNG